MAQSERIKQVLEVLDGIRTAAPVSLEALATERKTVTKALAIRRGIDERTIADKCWRGLWRQKDEKFHIAEFDALVWDWLNGAPDELRARCMDASTNDADRAAVTDFFSRENRVTRHRIRGDCQVWVEPWHSGASIVVNSVGGGPDRRPGLATLLEALAREGLHPTEAGYHPSGRDYIKLDGAPLSFEATLESPKEAAQAFQRAAGRVQGGQPGEPTQADPAARYDGASGSPPTWPRAK